MSYDSSVITLHGVNGDRLILHGPGAGAQGMVLGEEPEGLYDSPFDTMWDQGASQVGATYRARLRQPRDITATVHFAGATSEEVRRASARWRKAIGADGKHPATLEVTTAQGKRTLEVTPTKDPKVIAKHDPNVTGYVGKIVQLRAANPDYRGKEVSSAWVFDGVDYVGDVTVENPGDQPMALTWSLTSPASWILPDFSWASDKQHPDYRHRNRMVALPFQRWNKDPMRRQDAMVKTGVNDLQGTAVDQHQFQARWAGQSFLHMVPPRTKPTKLPVAVNPLPWSADIWRKLKLPGSLPANVLFEMAKGLSTVLEPIPNSTVLSWSPETLVSKIDDALDVVTPDVMDPWIDKVRTALHLPTAGELIANTYGAVGNMSGAAAKVYCQPLYSTPWEEA